MTFPIARTSFGLLGLWAGLALLVAGCGAARPLTIPDLASSQTIKNYRAVYIPASRPPWTGSGIEVGPDDIAVVMAFGRVTTWKGNRRTISVPPERFLYGRVGEEDPFQMRTNPLVAEVEEAGELRFTVRDWRSMTSINANWYRDNTGGYALHIFVVPRHRWSEFEGALEAIAAANPGDDETARQIRAMLGPRPHEVTGMDYGQLMRAWMETRIAATRRHIVQEFGRRKEEAALSHCFDDLVNGYFFNPWYWRRFVRDDLSVLADIYAVYPAGKNKDMGVLLGLLEDSDPAVRRQVLGILAEMKPREHAPAVYPLLFDKDPKMRIKALDTLIAIQNPEAANQISLLLIDPDKLVRKRAEAALRALDVPTATIDQWRAKARQLNMGDYFDTFRAHKRTVSEKQALEKKLATTEATKLELEEALRQRESAQKTQADLKTSLYEKERELQSQQSQLELAQQELDRIRREAQIPDGAAPAPAAQDEAALEERIASLNTGVAAAAREAEDVKQQLAAVKSREQDLVRQVEMLKGQLDRGSPPIIAVLSPQDGARVRAADLLFHMVAVDDKGVRKVDIRLNGRPVELGSHRGLKLAEGADAPVPKLNIRQKLAMVAGSHELVITAEDSDGLTTTETLRFTCVKERGTIWAVVVGINAYPGARDLKYAVNDARGFAAYLTDQVGVPSDHVFLLTDAEATKTRIESLLGTQLKRRAAEDDTVIIFYAGHGAVETDPSNPDGDGFEKYLLPHDARLDDLYASSISMSDIQTIFQRIRAKRLIFISDTCYSGSAGGRTLLTAKTRANLSDRFLDRISHGKGRVIISSCSANEISKEDDRLGHGIFSYYLLEGLRGKADQDSDGIITVDELFTYLSRKVPEASGQDQHPVKKGEMEGELVIGRSR